MKDASLHNKEKEYEKSAINCFWNLFKRSAPTVQKSTHHLHVCVPNHLGQRSAAADANRGDVKNYENEGDDEMRADFFFSCGKNTHFFH